MGSQQASVAEAPPQHECPAPARARNAAWLYFSLTTSLTCSVLIFVLLTKGRDLLRLNGLVPGAAFRVQESQQFFECLTVGAVADESLLAFGRDELVDLQFLEVMRERRTGDAGL